MPHNVDCHALTGGRGRESCPRFWTRITTQAECLECLPLAGNLYMRFAAQSPLNRPLIAPSIDVMPSRPTKTGQCDSSAAQYV